MCVCVSVCVCLSVCVCECVCVCVCVCVCPLQIINKLIHQTIILIISEADPYPEPTLLSDNPYNIDKVNPPNKQ